MVNILLHLWSSSRTPSWSAVLSVNGEPYLVNLLDHQENKHLWLMRSARYPAPLVFCFFSGQSRPFLQSFWEEGEIRQRRIIAILGSGAVGALAYTFSDSFWFSAVEGEVYAMSSFFTAVAFWAVLKWEQAVDTDPNANKWLLLIALVGLSVGVHILVSWPFLLLEWFTTLKKYPNPTRNGFILANGVSIAVLGLVFAFIIPIVLRLFSTLEIILCKQLWTSVPLRNYSCLARFDRCGFVWNSLDK